jgi:hypothetical protein
VSPAGADRPRIEIRSYRAVFDLERRLYRVDGFRLNPSGVPVRGVVYVALLVALVVAAQRAPVIDALVGVLPWQARYVAIPCGAAALLTILRIDGRPAHEALVSVARWAAAPRHLAGFARCARPGACWTPPPVGFIADGSGRPCRLRLRGPGAALVRAPHRALRGRRRPVLVVDRSGGRVDAVRVVAVRAGDEIDVRVVG